MFGYDWETLIWIAIGFGGQGLFMMRFVVQWWSSEKARQVVVPVAFWYFSILGGLVLTVYAIRMSAIAIGNLMIEHCGDLGGSIECGEMTIREETSGRLLPTAIFARWSRT